MREGINEDIMIAFYTQKLKKKNYKIADYQSSPRCFSSFSYFRFFWHAKRGIFKRRRNSAERRENYTGTKNLLLRGNK